MSFIKNKIVYGAGGGKGGGAHNTEDANTVRALMYARFQSMLCEGPIEGLVTEDMRSVFVDGSPVASLTSTSSIEFDVHTTAGSNFVQVTDQAPPLFYTEAYALYSKINAGMTITGSGIPADTTIYGKVEPNYSNDPVFGFTLSKACTATAIVHVVINSDTEYNFENFSFHLRKGTVNQLYMPGQESVESQLSVQSGYITQDTPQTFAVTDTETDAVRLSLYSPALSYQEINNKNGSVHMKGSSITYRIDILDAVGGVWKEYATRTLAEKFVSTFVWSERIELPKNKGPWTIKVTRVSADAPNSLTQSLFGIHSAFALYDLKLTYPHTAMFGGQISAAQFSSIPNVKLFLKLQLVPVPANYDPITRSYATSGEGTTNGVWDGTFKLAWTDNPAWCYHDLCVNQRYGLGKYLRSSPLDKWELYDLAQHCDELVPDGYGNMEPRFTCNVYITERREALKVLADMSSIFRAMSFYTSGKLHLVTDKPVASSALFTPSNVEKGLFTYSSAAQRARHTVAIVAWTDHSNLSQIDYEYVPDQDGIREYGINEVEVVGFGCASRGQAHRLGRYILFTERYESTVVSFTASLQASMLLPGMVIDIADPYRFTSRRLAGLVRSASVNSITFDVGVDFDAAHTYSVTLVNKSGKVVNRPLVVGASGTYTTLNFAIPLPAEDVPQSESPWAVAESDKGPLKYRILNIEEGSSPTEFKISAILHYPEKLAWVEEQINFDDSVNVPYAPPAGYISAVSSLSAKVMLSQNPSSVERSVQVTWNAVTDQTGVAYIVSYKQPTDTVWTVLPAVSNNLNVFKVSVAGTYLIRVVAQNGTGRQSFPAYANVAVANAYVAEGIISNLHLKNGSGTEFSGSDAVVEWGYSRNGVADPFPLLDTFRIRVYDMTSGSPVLLRTIERMDTYVRYSYDDNHKDTNGAPSRNLRFSVCAVEKDRSYAETAAAVLNVANTKPKYGANPPTHDGSKFIIFSMRDEVTFQLNPPPSDPDFGGTLVFVSTNPSFSLNDVRDAQGNILSAALVPYDFNTNSGMLLYQGWDSSVSLRLQSNTTYYYIYAPFDTFGRKGLNFYGPISVNTWSGASGESGLLFRLTNSSVVIPTDSAGNNGVFAHASTSLVVNSGSTDVTASWTLTATPSGGVTGTLVGSTYSVTGMTTDTGYVDFTATKAGSPTQSVRMSLAKAKSGASLIGYYISTKSGTIKKVGSLYTPVDFNAYSWTGNATPTLYAARVKIESSADGVNFTTVYTSSAPETTNGWSPSGTVEVVRITMYLGSDTGMTTPVDSQLIYVIENGVTGAAGTNGADAYTVVLTNEAHAVACDSSGNALAGQLGASGTAKTDIKVYKGTTALTAVSGVPAAGQFRVVLGTLTNCTATLEDVDTVRIDTLTAGFGIASLGIQLEGTANVVSKLFSLSKAVAGATGADAQYVTVTSERVFKYAAGASVPTNTSITLSAALFGGLTTYDWEYWNGAAWVNLPGTQNAATYSLAYNNTAFTGNTLRVRCLSGTKFDEITISKIYDGTNGSNGTSGVDAYTVVLTNEAQPVACDSSGTALAGELGASGKAKTDVKVYKGATALTATTGTPAAGQFKIVLGTLTSCTATIEDADTVRLDTVTADSGNAALTIQLEGTSTTVSKLFSYSKVKAGAAGTNGNNGQRVGKAAVYFWSTGVPAAPSGTSTYTWATGATTLPSTPQGFSLVPPVPPGASYRLYEASVVISNTSTTATDTVDWTSPTLAVIGYAGSNGTAGTNYHLRSSVASLAQSIAGVFTPTTVTFSALSNSGTSAPTAYSGRFIIADSTDGSTFTDRYTSSANESSKAFTPSSTSVKAIRCRMYLAGGTSTLLNEVTVTVAKDGATGTRGSVSIAYSTTVTSWADAQAVAALTAQGLTAQNLDTVTLYNTGAAFAETRVYNGSSWVAIGKYLSGNMILDGTLDAVAIKAITAWAKQFTIGTNGYFSSGQTAYNTGIGWWMEYNGGTPRMSLGNPSGNYFTFDGSNLNIKANQLDLGQFSITAAANIYGGNGQLRSNPYVYSPSGFYPVALSPSYSSVGGVTGDFGQLDINKLFYVIGVGFGARALNVQSDYVSYSSSSAYSTAALAWANKAARWSMTFGDQGITYSGAFLTSLKVMDRLNLWSASNPKLDIQNSLLITTSDGSYQIAKIDGVSFTLNSPLRIQPSSASTITPAVSALYAAAGAFVAVGGSNAENFSINITGMGFSAAPTVGFSNALDSNLYDISYRDDSSSATTAVFRVIKRSGNFAANEMIWRKVFLAHLA